MLKVTIHSWTASFRYPTFQSGTQPTLPVPPISTILGLLSTAKGEIVSINDVEYFGFIYCSKGKGWDLERIYTLGKGETDVIKREVLFDNTLYLYLPEEWEKYFRAPKYQLLLGRSSDIATVEEIEKIELEKRKNNIIKGTIVPLDTGLPGIVHALPVEFDYTRIPRVPVKVRPFIVIPCNTTRNTQYGEVTLYDRTLNMGVFIYEPSMFG